MSQFVGWTKVGWTTSLDGQTSLNRFKGASILNPSGCYVHPREFNTFAVVGITNLEAESKQQICFSSESSHVKFKNHSHDFLSEDTITKKLSHHCSLPFKKPAKFYNFLYEAVD